MQKMKSLDRQSAFVVEGPLEFNEDSKESCASKPMLNSERKEDEEEATFDRDFIKVEKENIDIKDSSQVQGTESMKTTDIKDSQQVQETASPVVQQPNSEVPSSEFSPKIEIKEAQENVRELEARLEAALHDLHGIETERIQLLSQVESANEELKKREEHSQQLELELKNLKEEFGSKNTLQLETLQKEKEEREVMQSELLNVKKEFDEKLLDLVTSRTKTEELELNLSSAINKSKEFEELCKEKDSHVEIQSKKISDYEKCFEAATLRTKEMEDKIAELQEELNDVHRKSAEAHCIEEEHKRACSDLQKDREELVILKSQVKELENRVISREATIEELTQDLSHCKASEEHAKNDLTALKNLFSVSKQELQIKTDSLKEVESKYEREVKINEGIESTLRNQHKQVKNLQEKLVKVTGEKEDLEAVSAELNASLVKAKETCELLENKLSESEQNLNKTDFLLTEARSYNTDIEQKLKSLDELYKKSVTETETAIQGNHELKDLLCSSNASHDELKTLLRETELKLVSSGEQNVELEQQLHLMEIKCKDNVKEISDQKEKTFELSTLLKSSEEQIALSRCHFQASEDRVHQLELLLNNSSKRIQELEQELTYITEKHTEHEKEAGAMHQRNLELEDFIQKSNSKTKDSESKVAELEFLLEETKHHVQELKEKLNIGAVKHRDAEEELVQFQAKVSELKEDAEALHVKSENLEIALQAATDKEKELTSQLNIMMEERNKFEQSSHNSIQQHMEAENLLKALQFELNSEKEKLEAVEKDLRASNNREQELLKKLAYTEDQLEHQERKLENASTRSLELETLHETLAKDSELKLQETLLGLSQKDSEAKQLSMKIQSIKEEATFYQSQASEARERATLYQNQAVQQTEKSKSLKDELEKVSAVQHSLEETIAKLKAEVQEAEMKAEKASSEYEIVSNTNSMLKEKVVECDATVSKLQDIVNSVTAEKDKTAEQLAFHARTLSEITDKHSRELDLHQQTESRAKETDKKYLETIEQLKIRDSETKLMNDKLLSLESQTAVCEKQASEATHIAENRKVELDEALLKIKKMEEAVNEFQRKACQFEIENESLAATNLKLSHDLASYENKLNELQKTLDSVLSDKNEILGQLNTSSKTVEDLCQQLAVEREKLQSQISSVMEENFMLSEMYQKTKKDLQGIISQLEGQLDEHKEKERALNDHIESMKSDLKVKSEMQARISELEQHLVLVDSQFKEEFNHVKLEATKKEEVLASKLEETISKLKERDDLASQLAQVKTELHHAYTALEQKQEVSNIELERQVLLKQPLEEIDDRHQNSIALEKKIEEHEWKLQMAEFQDKEKVEASMQRSIPQVETEQQHVLLLRKKVEVLEEKLQIAETKCMEKDIEDNIKLCYVNVELDGLKDKLNETADLHKKIDELENELQLASVKQNEIALEAEREHSVEIRSRDFSAGMTKPLRRKNKKRSESSGQPTETSWPTVEGHSLGATLKFILGIALVSMAIGVILGKRY